MDYYTTLGIAKTASPDEIKKAYRKLAMTHHPDRGGDEITFRNINEAYNILKEPDSRRQYDMPKTNFSFTPEDFAHSNQFSDFTNIRRTPRNQDVSITVKLDLKDIIIGKSLIIQYTLNSGRHETVTIDVPAGARHSDTIQYHGLGNDMHPQNPRGNLKVTVQVAKSNEWDREGDHLITKKSINVFDLLLGCVIIVKTLDNKTIELKIPAGTKVEQVFSIPGYGIPNINNKKRGNVYVTLDVRIPLITDDTVINEIKQIKSKIHTI